MRRQSAVLLSAALLIAGRASAQSTIFLGFDTQSPVQTYSTAGVFLANFGQGGATGSALDGLGHVWTVAPNFGNNQIVEYDAAQNVLNSFTATVNGQWIEDMGFAGGNSLWAGTFEGNIFNIDATTGAVNSTFAVPVSQFTGVTSDGTNVWATGGLAGNDNVYQFTSTGTLLNTFHTGFTDGMGIGFDRSTSTFWLGYLGGGVRQFNPGFTTVLSSFTAGSAAHDGLEVGVVTGQVSTAPEPLSLTLVGTGLAGLAAWRRRRREPLSA